MVRWILDAMEPLFPLRGTIGTECGVALASGVPGRPDRIPGLGPLGGLITALEWADEIPLKGIFLLGCDMPLVSAGLIQRILEYSGEIRAARVPASTGRLGLEPLCAVYGMDCLGPARELARSGRRSMRALLEGLEFEVVPLEALTDPGEGAFPFTNVNTIEEGRRVEAILGKAGRREMARGTPWT
jgi:molybdopterin-guanine dinucleotide biosynthesis protein A